MIDLSTLPTPTLLEELDFETLYLNKLERFKTLYPDYSAALKSDPVVKLLELSAYDELMYRARVNDAAVARLLAYATGADLDHTVSILGVARLTLVEADEHADPPVEPVYESDDRLRWRGQMALERLSVAGSVGAYRYHALSASADIADVSIDAPRFGLVAAPESVMAQLPANAMIIVPTYTAGLEKPMPGDVAINVLPVTPTEEQYATLLPLVESYLSADSLRPLTDHPRARRAQAVHYSVHAVLEFKDGVVMDMAYQEACTAVQTVVASSRALQSSVPRSLIYKALHVEGVKRVILEQPAADLLCGVDQYPHCDDINIKKH